MLIVGIREPLLKGGVMAQEDEKFTYNVDEVRKKLGVSRHTVYEALRCGQIPHIKLGRRFIIPKFAFDRWLENQTSTKELVPSGP